MSARFKQTFSSVIARDPSTEFTLSKAEGLRIWLEMTRKRIFAMTVETL